MLAKLAGSPTAIVGVSLSHSINFVQLGSFYRARRVLVTGHTGFKGGWLTAWLQAMGAEVVGFSLPSAPGDAPITTWAGVDGAALIDLEGDINDYESLLAVVQRHRPEIILHLAAQSLVRRSYREPLWSFSTNVMGTAHVLEAARHVDSVRAVVAVTSDKCYENREWEWGYRETDPLGGHDPYSASKGCAEIVAHAYRRSFFGGEHAAAIATARAGNVIGGGDWCEDRLVPDIFRGLVNGTPIVLRNPRSVRPWQHVLEPLGGYLHLARTLVERGAAVAEGWNFGPSPDDALTVREVAERIVSLWGSGELVVREDPDAPHEAGLLTLDCSKARMRLGWRPRLRCGDALARTVEWYRAFAADAEAVGQVTRSQIAWYDAVLDGRLDGVPDGGARLSAPSPALAAR